MRLPHCTDASVIDYPVTIEELKIAMTAMQRAKSPGMDGIPAELLLTSWNTVGLIMNNYIRYSLDI